MKQPNPTVPNPSKGGKARAAQLSPKRRSEIAAKGAATRWGPPKAVAEGELTIGEAKIPCAVIEGGIRVISQRGMSQALGRHVTGSGSSKSDKNDQSDGVAKLPNFLRAINLKQFIDIDLAASLSEPLQYIPGHGGRSAYGFKAELFPRICDVWLRAKDAGVLLESQRETADAAYMLMRGLAHVGIIALVDEATDYEDERESRALAEILEAFIAEELRKWSPMFPLKYYRELFRLHSIPFDPNNLKRPRYIGHLTNNIVYSRLAPGVLDELRIKNPKAGPKGRRKAKHHQWLTADTGHPALSRHLEAVTTLMAASDSREQFYQMLDRTKPVYRGPTLFDEFEEE